MFARITYVVYNEHICSTQWISTFLVNLNAQCSICCTCMRETTERLCVCVWACATKESIIEIDVDRTSNPARTRCSSMCQIHVFQLFFHSLYRIPKLPFLVSKIGSLVKLWANEWVCMCVNVFQWYVLSLKCNRCSLRVSNKIKQNTHTEKHELREREREKLENVRRR